MVQRTKIKENDKNIFLLSKTLLIKKARYSERAEDYIEMQTF
jgi:hypothetical protein